MSNWIFTTYGGFDVLNQALTMMALIFHNSQYQGLWFGVAVIGLVCAGLRRFLSGGVEGMKGISWIFPSIIGITLMFAFVKAEANLQLIDFTTGQTAPFNVPLGLAVTMSTLNKIEVGLVEVIATSGPVDMPNNYRKYSGGAGYDLFTNVSKNRDRRMENTLNNYMKDCVIPVAAFTGFTNFDLRDWSYADTPSGLGFFDLLGQGQSVLLTTNDETQTPIAEVSCSQAWVGTLFPFYSNPASFIPDVKKLCDEKGFDSTNAGSLAECHSKMAGILQGMTNKTMTAESYLQMQTMAQIAGTNLNNADPDQVAISQASKTLTTQGAGITAVFSHFAPIVRNIMWSLVILLIPLCVIFIVTPMFPKVLSFIAGLMVLLVSWTVIDCGIHTLMMGYVSSKFSGLATMGQGTMFYAQMPSVASETLGIYGMLKGASLMLATAFATIFGLQSSHAMTSFASGIQGSLDSAGKQAGAVAYTPEGRAQAINAQHMVSESMSNAHSFKPSEMTEKGRINSQNSMGQALGVKATHEEAMKNGIVPQGSSISQSTAEMAKRSGMNQIGGFKSQEDGMKAAKAQGIFPADGNLTDFKRASDNSNIRMTGTDGKAYSMAVNAGGKAVWSESKQGYSAFSASDNINDPTKHFDKTNLGGINTNLKEGISTAKQEMIGKAEKTTATAADNYSNSTSATRTKEDALIDNINKSTAFSDAEKKTTTDSIRASQTVSDADVKRLSETARISESAARATLTQTQVALNMSAGVGVPTNPVFKADMAASLTRSGAFTDTKSAQRALDAVDDKTWTHQNSVAKERSLAVAHAHDIGTTRGDSKTVSGTSSLKESESQQISSGKSLTNTVHAENDLRSSIQASENKGVDSNMAGDALLMKNLEGTYGKDEANRMVTNWNNASEPEKLMADKTKIQEQINSTQKQYASEVYAGADQIKAEREAGSASVQADITSSQQGKTSVTTLATETKMEVDAKRKTEHVEEGHVVKSAPTNITSADQHSVDGKFKAPGPKPIHERVETQLKAKMDAPGQGDTGAIVAAFTTPELGEKASALVGKVIGVSAPDVTHPKN